MLKESLEASGNRLRIPQIMQNPEMYQEAQAYIRQALNKLNRAENRALYGMPNAYSFPSQEDSSGPTQEEIDAVLGGE